MQLHDSCFNHFYSPRQQESLGVPSDQITCKENYVLFLNVLDDRPYCVIDSDDFGKLRWVKIGSMPIE